MKVSETNLISSLAGWSIEEPKDLLLGIIDQKFELTFKFCVFILGTK
jgi:hypothetical protein